MKSFATFLALLALTSSTDAFLPSQTSTALYFKRESCSKTYPVALGEGTTLLSHFGGNATYIQHISLSRSVRPKESLSKPKPSKDVMDLIRQSHKKSHPSMLICSKNATRVFQITSKRYRRANLLNILRLLMILKNPFKKLLLTLSFNKITRKKWLEYQEVGKHEDGRIKRYPLHVLLVKAVRCLATFSKKEMPRRTTTISESSIMSPTREYEREDGHDEMMDLFYCEAKMYLFSDPVVRAAMGFSFEVVKTAKVSHGTRKIRVRDQPVLPLEIGYQVRGSQVCGVAVALATKEDGIGKLTLHIVEGAKGRVIPVSFLKRSLPMSKK